MHIRLMRDLCVFLCCGHPALNGNLTKFQIIFCLIQTLITFEKLANESTCLRACVCVCGQTLISGFSCVCSSHKCCLMVAHTQKQV